MRLIDAERYRKEFLNSRDFEPMKILDFQPTIQAIVIPDNATNGDVIKAMFGSPAREEKAGILYKFKYRNGKPMFSTYFDFDWWNMPYKEVEKCTKVQ